MWLLVVCCSFFFSSRRRHTRCSRDWSSDVCSSDLGRTMWVGWLVYAVLALGMARATTAAGAWALFLGMGLVAGPTQGPGRAVGARLRRAGGQRGRGVGGERGATGRAARGARAGRGAGRPAGRGG